MAINRVDYPGDLNTQTDWAELKELVETRYLDQSAIKIDVVGGVVERGAVFQIGGVVYRVDTDETITGTASDYVRIVPDGATATAKYAPDLSGVNWNSEYNGYYDVSGNLYLFNEQLAILAGQIATIRTRYVEIDSVGDVSVPNDLTVGGDTRTKGNGRLDGVQTYTKQLVANEALINFNVHRNFRIRREDNPDDASANLIIESQVAGNNWEFQHIGSTRMVIRDADVYVNELIVGSDVIATRDFVKSGQNGGHSGVGASATSGGASGYNASATSGGAVGYTASATSGGAVGLAATAESGGGAVGDGASATSGGGAVGSGASATLGGAVGFIASATTGGAVGRSASATTGGAVGLAATATSGGGAVGDGASATSGGAVGDGASAISGGAVGYNASATTGFSGGVSAVSGANEFSLLNKFRGIYFTAVTPENTVFDYFAQYLTVDGQRAGCSATVGDSAGDELVRSAGTIVVLKNQITVKEYRDGISTQIGMATSIMFAVK